MRPSTSRASTLFATVLILSPATAGAATLVNGNFSDAQDFAGWQPTGDVLREPGGAFGQLETDGTFQRTLQQGFLVVGHHYRLSFDFAFSTQATTPPGAGVADALAVSIVTAGGDYLDILAADVVGAVPDPSDGNEAANNAVPIQVGLDPTVTLSGFLPFVGAPPTPTASPWTCRISCSARTQPCSSTCSTIRTAQAPSPRSTT